MPPAYQRSATDEEQIAYAERKVRRREARRFELVKKILGLYEGREFIWNELEAHGLFLKVEMVTVNDTPQIFQLEGKRNEGIRLYVECQNHPELYLQMQQEAIARAKREARELEALDAGRAAAEESDVVT